MRNALAAGQGNGVTFCQWVSAALYNGLGRYDEALAEVSAPPVPAGVGPVRVGAY